MPRVSTKRFARESERRRTRTVEQPSSAIEGLYDVRKLLANGWTQGNFNRLVDNKLHFCMEGAFNEVFRCADRDGYVNRITAYNAVRQAANIPDGMGVPKWNDEVCLDQAAALEAVDTAIDILEATEA